MRTLGVAILGVFLGIIAGFALNELVGVLALASGHLAASWLILLRASPAVLAVVGGAVAVVVDNRSRRRKGDR